MSKVRDLPETTTLADDDLLYAVDESAGPNGGRKIKKSNLKTSVAPTAAETKAVYESNPDTNAFTDAEKTKLAGIEPGATADQSAAEVPYDNSASGLSATQVQAAIDEVNVHAQADFRPSIVSGRILHYTGGTARFDDVFFELVGNDILLNQNIINGEVYVDLDGVVKQTASGITAPPLSIVFARFSTDLNNIISLTDERVKNTQNLVRGILADVRDVRAGAAASAGASGRLSDAMHKHNILTGAPSTQNPDQANAEGTSANLARADHIHNVPAAAPIQIDADGSNNKGVSTSFALADHKHDILAATPSTQNADQANAEGTSSALARADHVHNIPTAAPIQVNADGTNTQGASTSFAKADHKHDILTAAPVTQNPDQANAAGSSSSLARADHVHNIPADAPTTPLSPATTNAEGVGTSFARNDHTHAVATGIVGDVTTIQPDAAASAGTVDRFARADHRHAIDAAAPSTQNADQSNTEGVSTSFARADHVHNIPTAAPTDVGSANAQGSAGTFAKSDHVHKGVHSVKANAGTQRFGDLSLQSGVGTTVTDDGAGNFTVETNLGPNELYVTQGAGLIANYTAGRVRINGTTYSIVAGSITVATGATNGRIYVDVDGVVKSTTSTSTPPNAIPLAIFSSSGVAITALSDNRSLLNPNLQFGSSGDISTIVPDAAASAGSTNKYADAGHTHAIVAAAPSTQNADQANAEGVSTSFARADHVHNIPTAAATGLNANSTNTQGASTSFAKADHTHAIASGTPSTQNPDQANAAGTSTNFARADHIHNIPAAAPGTVSTTSTNTKGVSTSFALADHVHQVTVVSQEATATADDTTNSTTDTLMNSMTLTPAAGTYWVLWHGSIVNSANGAERTWVSLYAGGSQVSATERSIGTGGGAYVPSMTGAVITVNGSQAIELRWRVAGGTSTVHSRRLSILRIS